MLKIDNPLLPYGLSNRDEIHCSYQLRYPSEASYLDSLFIKIPKLENARVNIAIGKKSDGISNSAIESTFIFNPNLPGIKNISISYPYIYYISIQPIKDFVSVQLEFSFDNVIVAETD